MPDVVLPVLNEALALPWVLGRMPAAYRPLVVDNGSDDGSPQIAADLGAQVIHEDRRGFGSACAAGLAASEADVVCFMDADGSLDPGRVAPRGRPSPPRSVRPQLGRESGRAGRLAAPCPPGQPCAHGRSEATHLTSVTRPRSYAGGPATGSDCPRNQGSAIRVAARDGPACARFGLERLGGRCRLPGPFRAFEGDRHRTWNGPGYWGHGGSPQMTPLRPIAQANGAAALREVQIVVIAKEPLSGTVKTRLCPPLTSAEAAAVAASSLADTLDVVVRSDCRARWWRSRVSPTAGSRAGSSSFPSGRVASASVSMEQSWMRGNARTARCSSSAWTLPRCAWRISNAPRRRCSSPGVDTILGPADDGGYWLIGTRQPVPGMFAEFP